MNFPEANVECILTCLRTNLTCNLKKMIFFFQSPRNGDDLSDPGSPSKEEPTSKTQVEMEEEEEEEAASTHSNNNRDKTRPESSPGRRSPEEQQADRDPEPGGPLGGVRLKVGLALVQ